MGGCEAEGLAGTRESRCFCWALWRIFTCEEQHCVSGSEGAVALQNAKWKRHLDTGKFGLDW